MLAQPRTTMAERRRGFMRSTADRRIHGGGPGRRAEADHAVLVDPEVARAGARASGVAARRRLPREPAAAGVRGLLETGPDSAFVRDREVGKEPPDARPRMGDVAVPDGHHDL